LSRFCHISNRRVGILTPAAAVYASAMNILSNRRLISMQSTRPVYSTHSITLMRKSGTGNFSSALAAPSKALEHICRTIAKFLKQGLQHSSRQDGAGTAASRRNCDPGLKYPKPDTTYKSQDPANAAAGDAVIEKTTLNRVVEGSISPCAG